MRRTIVLVPRHSNVPRLRRVDDSDLARVLAGATGIVSLTFGGASLLRARARLRKLQRSVDVTEIRADGIDDLRRFRAAVARSSVGVRILLVGSEAEVYAARSAALAEGAIEDELALIVSDDTARRVYCAHCAHTSTVSAYENDVIRCEQCARSLVIYHHFSPRKAAYLGFMVDAEEAS